MPDSEVDMEPFSLLAHETRLDILRALFGQLEATTTDPENIVEQQRGVRYSTLMDAVGMEDSGKFNYHLGKLQGVYVERVDERYVPTASAIALYRTVLANQPTASQPGGDIDVDCPVCGEPARARYDREFLTIDCPHCEDWWGLRYPFPQNGLEERTGYDLFEALRNRAMYHVGLARTGQCPICAGQTTIELDQDRLDGTQVPTATFTCGTCSWGATVGVMNALRFDPQFVTVLTDLGVPTASERGAEPIADDTPVTVTGEPADNDRVVLTVHTAETDATVVINDELSVVAVRSDHD